ncbi:MAG: hypothetical protein ABL907_19580 [Hyphomicrobium sp.]
MRGSFLIALAVAMVSGEAAAQDWKSNCGRIAGNISAIVGIKAAKQDMTPVGGLNYFYGRSDMAPGRGLMALGCSKQGERHGFDYHKPDGAKILPVDVNRFQKILIAIGIAEKDAAAALAKCDNRNPLNGDTEIELDRGAFSLFCRDDGWTTTLQMPIPQ